MPRVVLLLLLFASSLEAQTPAERFTKAYSQWSAHRPDDMTWDDDSPAAVEALDSMWSAATQVSIDFLTTNKTATAESLSRTLTALLPTIDPKLGPPLSVSSIEITPGVFVVAFNASPAGTVFALSRSPQKTTVLWNLSLGGAQTNDPNHLLASWHASRAGNSCISRYGYSSGVCGPMTSFSLVLLPPNRDGQPRFFTGASYSKDMGATLGEQISVWTMTEHAPRLDWISLDAEGGDEEVVPNSVEYRDGTLRIAEKHEFKTFSSCGSCSGRQMIRRLRVTPDEISEDGLISVHPELDLLDDLFQRIAKGKATIELASPQVITFLRSRPNFDASDLGMLESLKFTKGSPSLLCFQSDGLDALDFTLEHTPRGYFFTHAAKHKSSESCGGPL